MTENKPSCVNCPEPFEPLFAQAELTMSDYFSHIDRDPTKGKVTISGQRYIMARAATFSVQLRQILEQEYGRLAAEKIAYNLGRAAGIKDAEFFMKHLGLERGPAALSAGPVHFAMVGWAFVDIFPESNPTIDDDYFLIYDHPYSFEAKSYLEENLDVGRPVCLMNAGYSSGWCQVAFGLDLAAKEITCRAKGDDKCIFVMAPPSRVNEYVVTMGEKYAGI